MSKVKAQSRFYSVRAGTADENCKRANEDFSCLQKGVHGWHGGATHPSDSEANFMASGVSISLGDQPFGKRLRWLTVLGLHLQSRGQSFELHTEDFDMILLVV